MRRTIKNTLLILRNLSFCLALTLALFSFSCQKTAKKSGGFDVPGFSDETADAGQMIVEANEDLTKIKILYKQNENKGEELKNALESDDAEQVRKISDEVVDLINDGTDAGKSAIKKIQAAQEMEINEDYRKYLSLKEESLTKQLEAFANYQQAAIALRDNYDPKNKLLREKIKEEFKRRSENYRIIMDKAKEYSARANEIAKESSKKQN